VWKEGMWEVWRGVVSREVRKEVVRVERMEVVC
jgi:hypothetical protein